MDLLRALLMAVPIALAGCAQQVSKTPEWRLTSQVNEEGVKVCQLSHINTPAEFTIMHSRIPSSVELGRVYLWFMAPELVDAAKDRWYARLEYDTDWRDGFLQYSDGWIYVQAKTLLLDDVFPPMEKATSLDIKSSRGAVHIDLTGLSAALPSLRQCAAEGLAAYP